MLAWVDYSLYEYDLFLYLYIQEARLYKCFLIYKAPDIVQYILELDDSLQEPQALRYRLNTARWIRDLAMPIHLIHGDLDPLIPFKSSERLVALNSNAKLHTIHGAVHNNISEFDSYHQSLAIIFEANGQ